MEEILFPLLIEIAMLSVVMVAVWSFLSFGGVLRNVAAQFALGGYGLLLGLLLLFVFFFPEARQTTFPYSDYYSNNWIAGGLFLWGGSTLLICSLAGFGLRGRMVLLLVIVNLLLLGSMLVLIAVPWDMPQITLPSLALDAGALIALGIILAGRQQRRAIAWRAILLAVGGVVVVALFYYLLGSYYKDDVGRNYGPPYIDGPVTLLSLALGLLIFFAGRAWSKSQLTLFLM